MYSGYDDYPSYGGFGMGSRGGGFSEQYRCYSVAMMQGNERQNVNNGGKSTLMDTHILSYRLPVGRD